MEWRPVYESDGEGWWKLGLFAYACLLFLTRMQPRLLQPRMLSSVFVLVFMDAGISVKDLGQRILATIARRELNPKNLGEQD
jgi:hypothetical protein